MGMLLRRHTAKKQVSVNFDKMELNELKAYATEKGIELPKKIKKAELVELLRGA